MRGETGKVSWGKVVALADVCVCLVHSSRNTHPAGWKKRFDLKLQHRWADMNMEILRQQKVEQDKDSETQISHLSGSGP